MIIIVIFYYNIVVVACYDYYTLQHIEIYHFSRLKKLIYDVVTFSVK